VAVAAVYDIRFRRIPNWLVLAGIAAGFAWNSLSPGAPGPLRAAEGLGLGFLLYFPLYLIRGRRAGDVKLLAAVGSITGGPANIIWVFLLTAILGAVIVMAVVIRKKRVNKTFFNVGWIVRDLLQLKAPYKSSAELDVTSDQGLRVPHAALMAVGVAAFIAITQHGRAI
jgi:prepilin peptidase CpaA